MLYFAYLVNKLRKESEELSLPKNVDNVESLLMHLQRRERERGYLLAAEHVRVTVNRAFAESFTRLDDGDEIGITPVTPTPPAPPK
ncbi:MAG: MoaD/ThiS family protein [Pseudomonadota bacterium]